jgi:hypothetical protein
MTITPDNQPHAPRLQIDLDQIVSAIVIELARIQTCQQCSNSVPSLIDNLAHLATEVIRLHAALIEERLISANLRAAIRAALGAQSDGEPDPLAYLRDEISDTADPDTSDAEWRWY